MADYIIVREVTDGFTHQGHASTSKQSYVKLQESFLHSALAKLNGAPLPVFIYISLSKESPRIADICDGTGIKSQQTVVKAIQFLLEHRFIEYAGRDGPNGAKQYRPLQYIYRGADNAQPLDTDEPSAPTPSRIPKNGKRQMENDTAQIGKRLPKNGIRPRKSGKRLHDEMNDDSINKNIEETFIHANAPQEKRAVKEILSQVGIAGKNLDILARKVKPETARLWAEWLSHVNRAQWTRPEGYCWMQLNADPESKPPYDRLVAALLAKENEPPRRPTITGKLANLTESQSEMGNI